jgi:hypothetical protein
VSNFFKHPIVAGVILIIIGIISVKYIEPNLSEGDIIPYLKYILMLVIIIYGYYDAFTNNKFDKQFVFLVLMNTIFLLVMVGAGILEILITQVERLTAIDNSFLDAIEKIII